LIIILALFSLAAAQDKPKVAVYVTDGGDKSMPAKMLAGTGAHGVVGEALVKAINFTGKGQAVNLTKEITREFGVSAGEAQAAGIGRQFGVQNLCVVTISGISGKSFNFGVKLIDVSAGRVTASGGPAPVNLSNPAGILQAATNIAAGLVSGLAVNTLAGGASQTAAAPQVQQAMPAPTDQRIQQTSTRQPTLRPVQPVKRHERLWIAVYVKGEINDAVKTALRNELLFALVQSERYHSIDNNDGFVAAVNREMAKLNVKDLSDIQIAQIGDSLNADFVCVANVSPVLNGYQVLSRIINVKDESVEEIGRAAETIASAADIAKIADMIVGAMKTTGGGGAGSEGIQQQLQKIRELVWQVEEKQAQQIQQVEQVRQQVQNVQRQIQQVERQAQQIERLVYTAHPKFARGYEEYRPTANGPRKLKNAIGIEWGVGLPYSVNNYYDYNGSNSDPALGIGTYFNLDLIYTEIFADAYTIPYAEAGLLFKIPVGNDYFKWYPILGLCAFYPGVGGLTAGSRVNIGIGETAYLTSEYLYSGSDNLAAYTLKSGIGWDIGFGDGQKGGFFRPEFRYHWVVTSGESRHMWEFRFGLGYKWSTIY
jgi:hypothetical protein